MLFADAVGYLKSQNTKRPLWKGQRQTEGGLEEPPHPLYPALSNSRASFKNRLFNQYNIWCEDNNVPKTSTYVRKKKVWDYPKEFLDSFAERLNIPDLPPGYGLVSDFNDRGLILNKTPTKGLAAKLGPIGVEVLDNWARPRTAFPVAFLKLLQRVIKSDSYLRGGNLIDDALPMYRADLLSRHKEHLKSFGHENTTTQACMDVSLAEEIQNFRAFWANRDNLLASAGQ